MPYLTLAISNQMPPVAMPSGETGEPALHKGTKSVAEQKHRPCETGVKKLMDISGKEAKALAKKKISGTEGTFGLGIKG